MRTATIERKTRETEILASVDLDGTGLYDIDTGIGFLDHMLESFSRHSAIDFHWLWRSWTRGQRGLVVRLAIAARLRLAGTVTAIPQGWPGRQPASTK